MKAEMVVRLKEALEAEHKAMVKAYKINMEFLGQLWKELDVHTPASSPVTFSFKPPKVRTSSLVRGVIDSIQQTFTIYDVVLELQKQHGKGDSDPVRAIIRNEINKLRYADKIEVVEPGKGSRSGVYRKKKPE